MTTGLELLKWARGADADELDAALGQGDPDGDAKRSALFAVLLSGHDQADLPLIRTITRHEIEAVRQRDDGCGGTLHGCCWLLFLSGDITDSALIWEAKRINFDTGCTIDTTYLMSAGLEETAQFATAAGLDDLAEWVLTSEVSEDEISDCREWAYFEEMPSPAGTVGELAAWMRS
jgi:hypothetical protein